MEALTQALVHRGPDSAGHHSQGEIHLGVRRLSIIDLQHGDQPIYNEMRDKAVVFNGEIYNHEALRQRLVDRGHVFSTHSDTEVIVHLYEEYGERCVDHLRGMFAFAIADGRKLFLARDRLGIKPLYYTTVRNGTLFLFASEIKAILRCRELGVSLDMQAFADTLVLSHSMGEHTLFMDIKALEPGHTMTVAKVDRSIERVTKKYYELKLNAGEPITYGDAEKKLIGLLKSAVSSHLIADVEVGVTLSGGLDSSLLATMMAEVSDKGIRTFTIGTSEDHPDVVNARCISNEIESLSDVWFPTFQDYIDSIPGFIAAQENLSRLHGLPYYMLCQRIGRQLKVCLNGEGADELFGGYPEYLDSSHRINFLTRRLPILKKLGISPSPQAKEVIHRLADGVRNGCYLERIFEANLKDSLVHHHLETTDKYSMAASLEIRVPYLDQDVVEFVVGLPAEFKVDPSKGTQKSLLKTVAVNFSGGRLAGIAHRKKLGFPAAGSDYNRQFARLCDELLPNDYLSRHALGFCFSKKVELLSFELFSETFLHQRGDKKNDFDVLTFIQEGNGLSGCW